MTGRSRHGLHAVGNVDTAAVVPRGPVPPETPGRPFLTLHQQSVVLAIGGGLDVDTAGRLRMFLSMFTSAGGPRELLLDLTAVTAVDEDGMAPIFEAEEAMRLRTARLRLASTSAAVDRFLHDVRCDRTLTGGRPTKPNGGPGGPLVHGRRHDGQD